MVCRQSNGNIANGKVPPANGGSAANAEATEAEDVSITKGLQVRLNDCALPLYLL